MHGDREQEPGHGPAGLPPFSARFWSGPPPAPGSDRPLPPWSSEGKPLGGEAGETPVEAGGVPWAAAELPEPAEPGEDIPSPPAAVTDAFAGEPWPGLEPEDEETAPAVAEGDDEEPWAVSTGDADEPWATAPADEPPTAEPWAGEPEPGMLADSMEPEPEPLVLDDAAEAEAWAAAAEADAGLERESAASSPIDELVDVAGEALAGANPWTEAPLGTWPGEAEAWEAATVGGDPAAEANAGDREIDEMAAALERLAVDLRNRGESALDAAGQGAIDGALAAFLAGWRAARRGG